MRFKNPQTDEIYNVTYKNNCNLSGFCDTIDSCNECFVKDKKGGQNCTQWVLQHPYEAADMFGYEVIEEESNNDDSNMVNHPSHYNQGGIECIDAIKSATCDLNGLEAFCTGNAIKYLWRWKEKNGVEDLNKAIWYINKLKESISDDERT